MITIVYTGTVDIDTLKDKEYRKKLCDSVIKEIYDQIETGTFVIENPHWSKSPFLKDGKCFFQMYIGVIQEDVPDSVTDK